MLWPLRRYNLQLDSLRNAQIPRSLFEVKEYTIATPKSFHLPLERVVPFTVNLRWCSGDAG